MARSIGMAADATVFRAVITKKYPRKEPVTVYEGPYGSKAAARARVTFWKNHLGPKETFGCPVNRYGDVQDTYADGEVEQGTVTWSPAD